MVKKGNCIGYGILYCCGKNYINKVDGLIKKSDELSIFFYPYFLFRVMEWITARNKLKNFEEIGNITKEQLRELMDI